MRAAAPALGHAGRHFFRDRTSAPRARHLGLGHDRASLVASGPLDRARLAALGCDRCSRSWRFWLGIPAATRVARASGRKDPQFVVIDEVAGQLITLIAAPIAWKSLLLGFILFRAFDIVKPPPVRHWNVSPREWVSWSMTWQPGFTAWL